MLLTKSTILIFTVHLKRQRLSLENKKAITFAILAGGEIHVWLCVLCVDLNVMNFMMFLFTMVITEDFSVTVDLMSIQRIIRNALEIQLRELSMISLGTNVWLVIKLKLKGIEMEYATHVLKLAIRIIIYWKEIHVQNVTAETVLQEQII